MQRINSNCSALMATAGLLFAGVCSGQTMQTRGVMTSSGGMNDKVHMVSLTTGGEQLAGLSGSGAFVNMSGFLRTVVLQPSLDHDHDGIPDEIDPDNDNDGLSDEDEITGALFTPATPTDVNNPDSDADGAGDGSEWKSGTSPTNQASVLAMTGIIRASSGLKVEWKGGTSVRQYLLRTTSLMAGPQSWQVVLTNEPPTHLFETFLDNPTNATVFYRITSELP